ncbi:AcrR family transcriptional regulator [Kibdelosporangium banguiense]|uniref:AcrR family transcriptional regulator n=1 Tax=Kibdelosporangium banguiense TaxID=1365924 RepID=A0ABS4U1H8_9PSEU|nr:helix-turn-helix domain-containing protein [Kibdelosporangium banguiense]MBP2330510.1 AcrR family transcriptional regulator [Kibdelosporangium banguiense]
MVRLTRAQQQVRTRAKVLAAAKEEFTEHGYAPAKVDRIAERAELTRGAVYSNFPSKRALYLAVLIDMVENIDKPRTPPLPPADALGVFARTWLERLPMVNDTAPGGRLQLRSLVGVFDDNHGRAVLAEVAQLEALLLATALESCEPASKGPARRVRLAALVLTLLDGSGHLAETAPGAGDPFDVVLACQHLTTIDLADTWAPPHLPYAAPAQPCQDTWNPPAELTDQISGAQVDLNTDGLIAVLGAGRLSAAEEAIRSTRPGEQVTVVVVTNDPAETGRLVRLRITDLTGCLRRVFTLPPLHLVLDDNAAVASALGVPDPDDDTEAAVRIQNGAIVARAHGRGAAYAAASTSAKPRKAKS